MDLDFQNQQALVMPDFFVVPEHLCRVLLMVSQEMFVLEEDSVLKDLPYKPTALWERMATQQAILDQMIALSVILGEYSV